MLEASGYALRVLRERPTFVEAEVQRGGETVAGRAVLLREGALYAGGVSSLESDIAASRLLFHPGRIRGAFPTLRG